MQITQEVLSALDEACQLAPTMRGYTVRQDSPVIATGNHGEVIVTLSEMSERTVETWLRLCRTKTGGTVSTNTQRKIVFFKP